MLAARRRKETLLPEITQLALEGHSSQAIADKLAMPKRTVNYCLPTESGSLPTAPKVSPPVTESRPAVPESLSPITESSPKASDRQPPATESSLPKQIRASSGKHPLALFSCRRRSKGRKMNRASSGKNHRQRELKACADRTNSKKSEIS